MDAEPLRKLSRSQLQKLAKRNEIKANLKSEAIIKLLIARQATEVLDNSQSSLSRKRRASSPTPPNTKRRRIANTNVRGLADSQIADGVSTVKHLQSSSPSLVFEVSGHPEHNMPYPDYDDLPSYGFTTRWHSPTLDDPQDGTPEPQPKESDLKNLIAQMEAIQKQDEHLWTTVCDLRKHAESLRTQASLLRAKLRAEKGNRVRNEAFLRYHRESYWDGDGVNSEGTETVYGPEWPHESVWGGRMRVLQTLRKEDEIEITTSDEEEGGTLDKLEERGTVRFMPRRQDMISTIRPDQMTPEGYRHRASMVQSNFMARRALEEASTRQAWLDNITAESEAYLRAQSGSDIEAQVLNCPESVASSGLSREDNVRSPRLSLAVADKGFVAPREGLGVAAIASFGSSTESGRQKAVRPDKLDKGKGRMSSQEVAALLRHQELGRANHRHGDVGNPISLVSTRSATVAHERLLDTRTEPCEVASTSNPRKRMRSYTHLSPAGKRSRVEGGPGAANNLPVSRTKRTRRA